MLIPTENPSVFTAGSADIMCILQLPTKTFHIAFFEESPIPGPIQPISELSVIRLKSKMHHTIGASSFEGAKVHMEELREKIIIPDQNVFVEKAIQIDDPVSKIMIANWTTGKITLKEALEKVFE